jgi:hypothetical protein
MCVHVDKWRVLIVVYCTGAVYGGGQAITMETKQSRKELEREVALGMFCVRVAEMKADWLANRYLS